MVIKIIAALVTILYSILIELLVWLTLPFLLPFLIHKSYLSAVFPSKPPYNSSILIHCASLGEINALKTLVTKLFVRHKDLKLAITLTNPTAIKAAKSISPNVDARLSVLDSLFLRLIQLRRINPDLVCIMETELWINLLLAARIMKKPIVFLNARMTDRTYKYYYRIRYVLRFAGNSIREINCQSQLDYERYGVIFPGKVQLSGNIKFALELPEFQEANIRAEYRINEGDIVIVFGSSRPREEKLIIQSFINLKQIYPNIRLIVALRHPLRIEALKEELRGYAYSLESSGEAVRDVHIVDTLGKLNSLYSIADIAIVGGSFFNYGGHNPLEPAFYSKAIIIGPFFDSCRDSVKKLLLNNSIVISEVDSLERDITNLINDSKQREIMGASARKVLEDNKESMDKHLESISRWLT